MNTLKLGNPTLQNSLVDFNHASDQNVTDSVVTRSNVL